MTETHTGEGATWKTPRQKARWRRIHKPRHVRGYAESQQKQGEVFGTVSHSVPPERNHSADTLILTFPSSRTVKECISDVLSHHVYGSL